MPNAVASLALVLWPVASVLLFRALPPGRALIACLLIGYLFLPPPPAGFDFPLMPPLNKETIPSLMVIVLSLALYRGKVQFIPESTALRVLLAVFVFSPFATVLTNPEPVFYGQVGLPGLRLREAVALMVQQSVLVAPFLLARAFLKSEQDQRDILLALFLGGMIYSLPMLLEVRLSPQLNIWIYGYFQHNFEQMIRGDGFRPIVFLYHGLWVAFFAMTSVVAAVALARAEPRRNKAYYAICALYLMAVLILCKSLGSLLYAIGAVPLLLVAGRRMLMHVAVLFAVVALAYPMLKSVDVVPTEEILHLAAQIDPERSNSLRVRFDNEDILVERAYGKPVFGWGIWGRNHILDGNSGRILTITDGRWIIVIGVFGWLGFLAEFGLLTLPIFLMWKKAMAGDPAAMSPFVGPVALLLAINCIDLIPNATLTPLTWLLAGALMGYAEQFVPQGKPRPEPLRAVL
ncbi:hypothetical protein [Flavimaricola marinus]|uniref:O-Antigen ligase n=1 Tax=Flavimaricola marinus TaxID=1819565 RepID=A0A238LBF1_9RHOB|nr:hypothetical protein [Flavimaricola marinus]SMY06893.1 hypothetical protein LOM8899_01023 [Flavimaricola marinus]